MNASRDLQVTNEARRSNTVHIPGAPTSTGTTAVVSYVASRRFLNANTDEDYAMAYWASARHASHAVATEALVEHMLAEARSILSLERAPSENMRERALELAQLAGAIGTTVGSEAELEQVTTSIGVTYAVRRIPAAPTA